MQVKHFKPCSVFNKHHLHLLTEPRVFQETFTVINIKNLSKWAECARTGLFQSEWWIPAGRSPGLTLFELHHAGNRDVSWPNLSFVHIPQTQRLMYSVKQPFERLTEQYLPMKGFLFRFLSQAFHHNHAQLRQGSGVAGICCTFPPPTRSLSPVPQPLIFLFVSLFLLELISPTWGSKEGRMCPATMTGMYMTTLTEVKGMRRPFGTLIWHSWRPTLWC